MERGLSAAYVSSAEFPPAERADAVRGVRPQHEGMRLSARARRIGSTLKNEIDVNHRHTIITDEPAALGGTDEGPAPHELLAAALAACVATMIELYAGRRDWALGALIVDADADIPAAGAPSFAVPGRDEGSSE